MLHQSMGAAARPLVTVQSLEGEAAGDISVPLPAVMRFPIRPDIVMSVHAAMRRNSRQPYAVSRRVGRKTPAKFWASVRSVSRIPRVPGGATHRAGQASYSNMCRGGRMFAPTQIWRCWHSKINLKKKRFALVSAIAASAVPSLVMARGHKIDSVHEIPLVVADEVESLYTTSSAILLLKNIGAYQDVLKFKNSETNRSGKGKMRNGRSLSRKGPLIVYATDGAKMIKAFRNVPGVEVLNIKRLNLLSFAPGGHLGRFVIWTKSAFENLDIIYGSYPHMLPRSEMLNTDLCRIVNSDEIQSVVRKTISNPYIKSARRKELLLEVIEKAPTPYLEKGFEHSLSTPYLEEGFEHSLSTPDLEEGFEHSLSTGDHEEGFEHSLSSSDLEEDFKEDFEHYLSFKSYLEKDIEHSLKKKDLPIYGLEEYELISDSEMITYGMDRIMRHSKTKELVAMKFIERGDKIDSNLTNDLMKHDSLRHPNIISLKDVILTSTHLVIVMEYAKGGPLFDHITSHGRFNEDKARCYFQQMICAVDYSHDMETYDRGLKVENMLLDASCLKICDIGYSKPLYLDSKPSKPAPGSKKYPIPEVSSMPVDDIKLSDALSCGVALHFMLVGANPPNLEETYLGGYKIHGDYNIPDEIQLSEECKKILSCIFVADPSQRISVKNIKNHPWYLKNLLKESAQAVYYRKYGDRVENLRPNLIRATIPPRPPRSAEQSSEDYFYDAYQKDLQLSRMESGKDRVWQRMVW